MLAALLNKHGLKARVAESGTVSAGNIISLDALKTKLVCLSFLGIGSSSAQVRYLVRRLRRILPSGSIILVGCWTDDAAGAPVKALKETAEADAYATTLKEAARFCIDAARGHEQAKSETPAKSDTAAKDDKAPKDGKTPPAKGEKPAKDEKAAARVA